MKILLLLIVSIINFPIMKFQKTVSLVVESQEKIEIKTGKDDNIAQSSSVFKFPIKDTFQSDRRITFKVINESNEPLIIYGSLNGASFEPTGYMLKFDNNKEKWKYPGSENKSEELSYMMKQDKKVLKPRESLEFTALMNSEGNKDKLFKRTIYFSFMNCDEPTEIISDEFSLK